MGIWNTRTSPRGTRIMVRDILGTTFEADGLEVNWNNGLSTSGTLAQINAGADVLTLADFTGGNSFWGLLSPFAVWGLPYPIGRGDVGQGVSTVHDTEEEPPPGWHLFQFYNLHISNISLTDATVDVGFCNLADGVESNILWAYARNQVVPRGTTVLPVWARIGGHQRVKVNVVGTEEVHIAFDATLISPCDSHNQSHKRMGGVVWGGGIGAGDWQTIWRVTEQDQYGAVKFVTALNASASAQEVEVAYLTDTIPGVIGADGNRFIHNRATVQPGQLYRYHNFHFGVGASWDQYGRGFVQIRTSGEGLTDLYYEAVETTNLGMPNPTAAIMAGWARGQEASTVTDSIPEGGVVIS